MFSRDVDIWGQTPVLVSACHLRTLFGVAGLKHFLAKFQARLLLGQHVFRAYEAHDFDASESWYYLPQ